MSNPLYIALFSALFGANNVLDGAINGAIVGGVAGGAGALVFVVGKALFQKPVKCPNCGTIQPKARKPKNRKQTLWGGWTCNKCGCEIDAKGKMVDDL